MNLDAGPVQEGVTGKRLVGIQALQVSHHVFTHGVELDQILLRQRRPVGIAGGLVGLDGHIQPAALLVIRRIARDQACTLLQGLFAHTGVG